jgi:Flp pilus assembly protein TadG
MSVQFAVILVPVLFGMMGFAVDLGRIYLIHGELNQAASAMALAAAGSLNGTDIATVNADAASNATIDAGRSDSNKYNFGSLIVGQGNALLDSYTPTVRYSDTLASALANGSGVSASAARFASATVTADAPLLFWALFNFGSARKATISASAVAGISAPLCTACGIEPFAIAPLNAADTTDFGFIAGDLYTLGFQCTGAPVPAILAGTTAPRVPYVLWNGYNTDLAEAEDEQLFQTGAQGLLPAAYSSGSLSCATIGSAGTLWASAPVQACAAGANASVEAALCGLSSRLTTAQPTACTNSNDLVTASSAYAPDTDAAYITEYTQYQGNNRRLMTVPIVDGLSTLNVLGFRQFLVEPNSDGTPNNPADADGRFIAMYVGVVAPVKQGRFDGPACPVSVGPGKVVLHQ